MTDNLETSLKTEEEQGKERFQRILFK